MVYTDHETWWTCQTSRFGDGGHDMCSMGPKRLLGRVVFSYNFWLEWCIRINGTWGTCQTSRFGDGGHDRCSMGPKRLLGRVVFSLKSPHLRGFSDTFLASNITKEAVISGWNGSYGSMGPGGHVIYEGGSVARSWPLMSPKWLKFLVGMIWMVQWDLGGMSDV